MVNDDSASRGYWYDAGIDRQVERGRRVLEAMRVYRAADVAMRRRTRNEMAMGDNELLALRLILRQDGKGTRTTPSEVASYLGITTASTTSLLDRLERSGHVERRPHPTDRRRVVLLPTERTNDEVRKTLGDMHKRMMDATHDLSDDDAVAIVRFLDAMTHAVDQIDRHA
ncbi:MarR family winged helix-turn-helix transcriptional regulator [Microbacterium sp. R86528]|uniref:MarR family winged helix-turn-helix transcriptional regulator n=1 Tax=Microbacterium sp. R86528 TaxID=3093864 RepID=UPI0037C84F05